MCITILVIPCQYPMFTYPVSTIVVPVLTWSHATLVIDDNESAAKTFFTDNNGRGQLGLGFDNKNIECDQKGSFHLNFIIFWVKRQRTKK